MRIKATANAFSESGSVVMTIDKKKFLIGSWMWRITKSHGKKKWVYIVITIWPRDREFATGFLTRLETYGKESHLTNFVAKRSKLIEQEFEMTYCTYSHAGYAALQCKTFMQKIFRSSHFSPLALAI